jgi:NIMA (never in mitosis gene a)-related kinase
MATLKPPFRAEDMDGLYKRVVKGSYQKIGDNYSKPYLLQLNQCYK